MPSYARIPTPSAPKPFMVVRHGRPRPFVLTDLDASALGASWLTMEGMGLWTDAEMWDWMALLLALPYALASKPIDAETLAIFGIEVANDCKNSPA